MINIINFFCKLIKYVKYKTMVYPYPKKNYQRFCDEEMESSYVNFKPYFYSSLIMKSKYLKPWALKTSLDNNNSKGFFLEFGVYLGESINLFSKILETYKKAKDDENKIIYGFDAFLGLKENWVGTSGALHLPLKSQAPKVNKNVILIKGWIQETLEPFLIKNNVKRIQFVNIDVDTYETTKFILQLIKPLLYSGSIIIFDELYNFPGWKVGEYKALKECFIDSEYKFICFAEDGKQAVIEIL